MHLVYVVLTTFQWNDKTVEGYRGTINVAYYELSPYIYRNENGSTSGIVPELLEEVSGTCVVKFRYSLNLLSANHFSRQIENKTWMKQYERGD